MAEEPGYFDQAAEALVRALGATNIGEQAHLLDEALRLNRLGLAEEKRKRPSESTRSETLLEMAKRHVAQGEKHIARQELLIGRLRDHNLPTEDADALLVWFEESQAEHTAHLQMIKDEQESGKRDADGDLIPT